MAFKDEREEIEMLKNAMTAALDLIDDGVAIINRQGLIIDINKAGRRQLGPVLGRQAEEIFGAERWGRMRREEEVRLPQKLTCRVKENFDGWVVAVRDTSYLYDALTGVYTRTALDEEINRLEQDLSRAKLFGKKMLVDVIFVDVDGLKQVNDMCGHVEGDSLLRKIAESVQKAVRSRDIVGRYGGDEFVVIVPRTQPGVREKIVARIYQKTREVGASVSIGAETIDGTGALVSDAVREADMKMYDEKHSKKR
ncbi:MAG: diguanylate cyclase [Patescibacteria group bacterium]|nr:diguanylate cyclase [Patescibacteria group bacterium]MCL5262104.1 diguanylate cyclase [Patescibacteria group bacterium]